MDQDPLSSLELEACSLLKSGPSTIGWIFLIPDPWALYSLLQVCQPRIRDQCRAPARAITRWSISSHTDDQLFEHLKTNVSLIPDPTLAFSPRFLAIGSGISLNPDFIYKYKKIFYATCGCVFILPTTS